LLARKNFGCGSSREHAPWALAEYGFRAIVAPSYGDIFFSNCCKNGLLPVILDEAEVDRLFHEVAAFPGFRLVVDLERQTVTTPDGGKAMRFDIEPFRKYCWSTVLTTSGSLCVTRTKSAPSKSGAAPKSPGCSASPVFP